MTVLPPGSLVIQRWKGPIWDGCGLHTRKVETLPMGTIAIIVCVILAEDDAPGGGGGAALIIGPGGRLGWVDEPRARWRLA